MNIYYIIAKQPNGDEWVLPETFTDEALADEKCAQLNDPVQNTSAYNNEYRVEATTNRQQAKLVVNSLYGKVSPIRITRQHLPDEQPYAGTDSLAVQPQRADFTRQELFPFFYDGCTECGVPIPTAEGQERHTTWHNKLLP